MTSMDINAAAVRTLDLIGREGSEETWIEVRLRRELTQILTQLWSRHPPDICPLADVGEYFLRVLQIVSHFANAIAYGNFIHEHATSQLQSLLDEDDGSVTDYLDGKHDTLKTLANELNTATNTCIAIWKKSPSPVIGVAPGPYIDSFEETYLDPVNLQVPNQTLTNESEQSMDMRQESTSPGNVLPSMEQLQSRGAGNYTCPYGKACDKDGVLADGQLRVFKQNNKFRAHLLRHEKIFKCDLPGCTNTKGFARIDQLERHKREVKHKQSGWITETPRRR